VQEELELIGKWIKNIHLKDRILRGPTVPLGEGAVKFDKFFLNLAKIQYTGDLIIQGARMDDEMDPIQTSKKYYKFVKQYVDKYLL